MISPRYLLLCFLSVLASLPNYLAAPQASSRPSSDTQPSKTLFSAPQKCTEGAFQTMYWPYAQGGTPAAGDLPPLAAVFSAIACLASTSVPVWSPAETIPTTLSPIHSPPTATAAERSASGYDHSRRNLAIVGSVLGCTAVLISCFLVSRLRRGSCLNKARDECDRDGTNSLPDSQQDIKDIEEVDTPTIGQDEKVIDISPQSPQHLPRAGYQFPSGFHLSRDGRHDDLTHNPVSTPAAVPDIVTEPATPITESDCASDETYATAPAPSTTHARTQSAPTSRPTSARTIPRGSGGSEWELDIARAYGRPRSSALTIVGEQDADVRRKSIGF
jgi:hypothetical protein